MIWEEFTHLGSFPPELKARFNSFLTTGFDDSLSVEMQLRSVIKWCQGNFKTVETLIDFINELSNWLKQFETDFDTKLEGSVISVLSEWQASGQLDVVISDVLQWQLDDYIATNEQDKLSLTTQLQQTVVKADTAALKADAMASGSPKGVYATLALLQAAYPTGTTGAYLVSADGKWYYWSGSAWAIGGVYQATGLADNGVTTKKINAAYLDLVESTTITRGRYISGTGTFTNAASLGTTDNLPIVGGVEYFGVFGDSGGVLGMKGCFFDSANNPISGITLTTNVVESSFIAPSNASSVILNVDLNFYDTGKCYLSAYNKAKELDWLIVSEGNLNPSLADEIGKIVAIDGIVDRLYDLSSSSSNFKPMATVLENFYYSTNGVKNANPGWRSIDLTLDESKTYAVTAGLDKVYTNVAIVVYKDADGNVVGLQGTDVDTINHPIAYKMVLQPPIGATLACITSNANVLIPVVYELVLLNEIRKSVQNYDYQAFGDSITAGIGQTDGNGSYANRLNNKVYFKSFKNNGVSGSTTVATQAGTSLLYTKTAPLINATGIITVATGTNDFGNNVPIGDAVDSLKKAIDSIPVTTTYNAAYTFADGFRYTMEKLRLNNPDALIFCLLPINRNNEHTPNTVGNTLEQYREVQRIICKHLGIKAVEMQECGISPYDLAKYYTDWPIGSGSNYDGLHPNDYGYDLMAEYLYPVVVNSVMGK